MKLKTKDELIELFKKTFTKEEKFFFFRVYNAGEDMINVDRIGQGFTAYDLLGMLEKIQLDILKQIAAGIKPGITTRTIIKEEGKEDET